MAALGFLKLFDLFSQLFILFEQLLVLVKAQTWKLAVLLHELKQVIPHANAMMRFVFDRVFRSVHVSKVEVEGTIFQFETEAFWPEAFLCIHEQLILAGVDVDDPEAWTLAKDNEWPCLHPKLGHLNMAFHGEVFWNLYFPDDFHTLDDQVVQHVSISTNTLNQYNQITNAYILDEERGVVLDGLGLNLPVLDGNLDHIEVSMDFGIIRVDVGTSRFYAAHIMKACNYGKLSASIRKVRKGHDLIHDLQAVNDAADFQFGDKVKGRVVEVE